MARTTKREKIIAAFMGALSETPYEKLRIRDIAARAEVSLGEFSAEFGSLGSVARAYLRQVDQRVLDGIEADSAEQSTKDRLFDLYMRRLETFAPNRTALRNLARHARRDPKFGLALACSATRSHRFMLEAAGIDTNGPFGALRIHGMAAVFGRVLRTFFDDDSADLDATMRALDEGLERAGAWGRRLEDCDRLSAPFRAFCAPGRRRSRRRPAEDEGDPALAI